MRIQIGILTINCAVETLQGTVLGTQKGYWKCLSPQVKSLAPSLRQSARACAAPAPPLRRPCAAPAPLAPPLRRQICHYGASFVFLRLSCAAFRAAQIELVLVGYYHDALSVSAAIPIPPLFKIREGRVWNLTPASPPPPFPLCAIWLL